MKFKITRAKENNFESGLRGFFAYKNLRSARRIQEMDEFKWPDFGSEIY